MFDLLDEAMPGDVQAALAGRVAARRKERGMTQAGLASVSGVSLGSIRRFEQQHEISLNALVRIAFALGCERDFDALFGQPGYARLDDVVAAVKRGEGRRS